MMRFWRIFPSPFVSSEVETPIERSRDRYARGNGLGYARQAFSTSLEPNGF